MNGDRDMPSTPVEVWESVYSGLEGLGSVIGAQQSTIERQNDNLARLNEDIAKRPTRKETGGFLALVFAIALLAFISVVVAVFWRLEDGQNETKAQVSQVRGLAEEVRALAKANRTLIERAAPCLPDDPPDSEACKRKAQTDAFVADVLAEFGAEAERQHNQLLRELDRRPVVMSAPTTRRPPTTTAPSPATAPAPATTTTTTRPCGVLGVGTCRG